MSKAESNTPKKILDKYDLILYFKDNDFSLVDKVYNRSKVAEIISLGNLKKITRHLSNLVMISKKEKTDSDQATLPEIAYYYQLATVIVICIFFVFYLIGFLQGGYFSIIIGSIFMVTALVMAMLFTCYNFMREMKPYSSLEAYIKHNFDKYLVEVNKEYSHLLEFNFVGEFDKKFLGIKVLGYDNNNPN